MAIATDKLQRRRKAWLRSQMHCGDSGCGECRVCRRLDFLEWVSAVSPSGIPCSVAKDREVDAYIASAKPPKE
jgi:hypothetical protein